MQLKMEEDGYVERLIFSDEATFHVSGKVSRHNVRIWGTERDSPKVNVHCAVSREKVDGPFFFTGATVTGDSFLDILEIWLLNQLNANYDVFYNWTELPPPHFHTNVRALLNCVLQQRRIECAANGDKKLHT
jgi:hypothetical protein